MKYTLTGVSILGSTGHRLGQIFTYCTLGRTGHKLGEIYFGCRDFTKKKLIDLML